MHILNMRNAPHYGGAVLSRLDITEYILVYKDRSTLQWSRTNYKVR